MTNEKIFDVANKEAKNKNWDSYQVIGHTVVATTKLIYQNVCFNTVNLFEDGLIPYSEHAYLVLFNKSFDDVANINSHYVFANYAEKKLGSDWDMLWDTLSTKKRRDAFEPFINKQTAVSVRIQKDESTNKIREQVDDKQVSGYAFMLKTDMKKLGITPVEAKQILLDEISMLNTHLNKNVWQVCELMIREYSGGISYVEPKKNHGIFYDLNDAIQMEKMIGKELVVKQNKKTIKQGFER